VSNQEPSHSIFDTTIRLFLMLIVIVWCLLLMSPFVNIILWSLILTVALSPLHCKLTKKVGGRPKLVSGMILLAVVIIFFVPSWMLIDSLVDEVKELKTNYDNGTLAVPPPADKVKEWPIIGEKIYETWRSAHLDLEKIIIKHQVALTSLMGIVVKGTLGAIGSFLQIMAALCIASVLLAVGGFSESSRKFFRKVAGKRGDEFADICVKTVGNVVKGIIGVALILALLNGICFLLAGVPYAGVWTTVVFVLGVLQVPLFFVTVPVIIYLFAMNSVLTAILWTALLLVVGLSDNILRPILLGKGAPVPMMVIFVGVIGGFIVSGFIGLFTGAIVMSLGYKLYLQWINSDSDSGRK
jgi:predicted PurR-regulated permease PerM